MLTQFLIPDCATLDTNVPNDTNIKGLYGGIMIVAGVGSRSTPETVCDIFANFAEYICEQGVTLRTGGAQGADQAFIRGAYRNIDPDCHVFVPWNSYEATVLKSLGATPKVPALRLDLAEQFHPNWGACSAPVRRLHARNVAILLGSTYDQPADLVVCWTPGGQDVGGTAHMIRMARHYGVPVCNVGFADTPPVIREQLFQAYQSFL